MTFKHGTLNLGMHLKVSDTHREKTSSDKTPELTKSMNMEIWVVGSSNQPVIRGSYTETKL